MMRSGRSEIIDPAIGIIVYRRVRWESAAAGLLDLMTMIMEKVEEVIEVVRARKKSKIMNGFSPTIMFIKI